MPKYVFERWVKGHEWHAVGSFNGSVKITNEGPDRLYYQEAGFDGSVGVLELGESFAMNACTELKLKSCGSTKVRIRIEFHTDEDLAEWLLEQKAANV